MTENSHCYNLKAEKFPLMSIGADRPCQVSADTGSKDDPSDVSGNGSQNKQKVLKFDLLQI